MKEEQILISILEEDICRNDFYYFYQTEFCYGKDNWKPAPFVKYYCRLLQGLDRDPEKKAIGVRVGLLAPRDHLKSSIGTAYCIWRMKYHKQRGYIISATQELANQKVQNVREEIENNPKFKSLIPEVKDQWGTKGLMFDTFHHNDTTQKIWLKGKGYGANIRGPHPDFILFDDIYGDDKNPTPLTHEFIIRFFREALISMVRPEPYSSIIFVGTKNDIGDLYDELAKNKIYTFRKFKAIIDEQKQEVLWPQVWSYKKLMSRKDEIDNDLSFNKEYQNEVYDNKTSLFPLKEMLIPCRSEEVNLIEGSRVSHPRIQHKYILSVDPPGNFMILEVNENKKIYFCNYIQPKVDQDTDLIYWLRTMHEHWNFNLIIIEENYIKMFTNKIRDLKLPIQLYRTGTRDIENPQVPTLNRTAMLTRLQTPFNNHIFVFPYGCPLSKKATTKVFDELNRLRLKDNLVETVGKHIDAPICLGAGYHFIDKVSPVKRRSGQGF